MNRLLQIVAAVDHFAMVGLGRSRLVLANVQILVVSRADVHETIHRAIPAQPIVAEDGVCPPVAKLMLRIEYIRRAVREDQGPLVETECPKDPVVRCVGKDSRHMETRSVGMSTKQLVDLQPLYWQVRAGEHVRSSGYGLFRLDRG